MKTGILISARLGSTRLEKKHLLQINNKEIICYLLDRINLEFEKEIKDSKIVLIIATGNKKSNQALANLKSNYEIFYGDDDNIPKRQSQVSKAFGLKNIISVDGDDILCSTQAMRQVYEKLLNGELYTKTIGLPLGMNVLGYKTAFLEDSLKKISLDILETGWGRIFDESNLNVIEIDSKDEKYLRFTLDYNEDFTFFKNIITHKDFDYLNLSDQALINFVLKNKIYKENSKLADEYWENFYSHMKKEG